MCWHTTTWSKAHTGGFGQQPAKKLRCHLRERNKLFFWKAAAETCSAAFGMFKSLLSPPFSFTTTPSHKLNVSHPYIRFAFPAPTFYPNMKSCLHLLNPDTGHLSAKVGFSFYSRLKTRLHALNPDTGNLSAKEGAAFYARL